MNLENKISYRPEKSSHPWLCQRVKEDDQLVEQD